MHNIDYEFIFLDLETTGCRPVTDRIIEIAFHHVVDNEIIFTWNQLINPNISIPPGIQNLTGINNEMVINAPTFADVATDLAARLSNTILVAHNARFDYGFLKNEFKRVGISFQSKTLCTVKLSRLLFPEYKSHSLDAISARLRLEVEDRHRALGDVKLMFQFYKKLYKFFAVEQIEQAIKKTIKQQSLPSYLSVDDLNNLPELPGVYFFYGENGALLYVGKSNSLRDRVMSHFSSDHATNKEMQMVQQVRSIDWITTAGELGALLKEAQLIKQHKPIFNRRLRRCKNLFSLQTQVTAEGYQQLKILVCAEAAPTDYQNSFGLFRNKRSAEAKLRELAKTHQLCQKLIGLDKSKKACFYFQLHKCKGACIGVEPAELYNLRVQTAVVGMQYRAWPYKGKVAIKESCSETLRSDYHIVDDWRYLATVNDEAEIYDFQSKIEKHNFDVDTYKIINQFIKGKKRSHEIICLE